MEKKLPQHHMLLGFCDNLFMSWSFVQVTVLFEIMTKFEIIMQNYEQFFKRHMKILTYFQHLECRSDSSE